MFSENIDKAIRIATFLHKDQVRKSDGKTPYSAHLTSVYWILCQYKLSELVLVAGILHDTIEDTSYTEEELEKDFGRSVASVVMGVTEKKYGEDGNKLSWDVRKKAYLENLLHVSRESLFVCAADKIHNMQTLVWDIKMHGRVVLKNFGAGPKEQVCFHGTIYHILVQELHRHAIVKKYREVFNEFRDTLHAFCDEQKEIG